MADVTINYEGNAIATMSASGTKTLLTEGKYCTDDIEVVYVSPGGGGGVGLQWTEFTATSSAGNAQACREMLFPNLAEGKMQIAVLKNPDSLTLVENQLVQLAVFRRGSLVYDGAGFRVKTSGQWTFPTVSNTYDAVISVGSTYYISEEVTVV